MSLFASTVALAGADTPWPSFTAPRTNADLQFRLTTTGGVTAAYAALGDVILAEPKALIGFTGPRVIEQTIRQKLPEGFQRSEFLLKHGMLDAVVPRLELKEYVATALRFFVD